MALKLAPVKSSPDLPAKATVAIIGGGIVGISAALTLAERGISVVVLEKGQVGAEQSSRNLGWIRKTLRDPSDIPLALAADQLWSQMAQRTGVDVGYRQNGIMFVSDADKDMEMYSSWFKAASEISPQSRLISPDEIDQLAPGCQRKWKGGLYTPTDGYAEPTLATSALANAAIDKGAVIVENCAVRDLAMTGGRVSGVITEKGEVAAEHVILASALWSRRFLGNRGIPYPTLPMICYVFRTAPIEGPQGPSDLAVAGPNFSFRKHQDGGYVITHRAALGSPITLDHLLIGLRYLKTLKHAAGMIRLMIGKPFIEDLKLARRWKATDISPFEKVRTMDPPANEAINNEALDNIIKAWPAFANATIEESWAGMIDITPDNNPVFGPIDKIPGLTLATGLSGHGFGTGPAAGQLAADLATGAEPIVDPTPYRFDRL
nr:FAD-binding oxidoreductase [uncultured Cohaesibacter sp.]